VTAVALFAVSVKNVRMRAHTHTHSPFPTQPHRQWLADAGGLNPWGSAAACAQQDPPWRPEACTPVRGKELEETAYKKARVTFLTSCFKGATPIASPSGGRQRPNET